jgi:hypothetical protein
MKLKYNSTKLGMLMAVFLFTQRMAVNAQFTFATNNGTLTIVSYAGTQSTVTIPRETNGMPIVAIASNAFLDDGSHGLINITIPNSITSIGSSAFGGNVWLSSATIPNSVTNLGDNAFSYCPSMTSAVIGSGIKSLNGFTFSQCYSLQAVFFQGNAPSAGNEFYSDNSVTVYYLPGTTNWSSTFAGRPAVIWNPQFSVNDGSFGIRSNSFGFNVVGTSNIPIALEACTNLTSGNWQRLQTCTLTNGSIYLFDTNWTNSKVRFYRVSAP